MDSLSLATTGLFDLAPSEVDELELDVFSDYVDFDLLPSENSRFGADMGALVQAQAAPPTTLVTPSPLAALHARWAALTDAQKLAVFLLASVVVVIVGGAVTGALVTKSVVTGHVGHALGHAALAAAPAIAAVL